MTEKQQQKKGVHMGQMESEYKDDIRVGSFHFKVDQEKCIHCKKCIKVCSTVCLYADNEDNIRMKDGVDGIFGWGGCYRCQHCMAVCPTGAISIFDRNPEDSVLPDGAATSSQLEALMRNRRAIRGYLNKEVPRELIDQMLRVLENVPTGSNRQSIEFSVVYDRKQMDIFRKLVRDEAYRLAEQGIYPGAFSKKDFELQASMEPYRNPGDMFFVNAPHMLIVHSPKGKGTWTIDPILAVSWFELLCAANGLGSIIMTYPVGALSKMPKIQKMLDIPEDRHFCCLVGFGYPDIKYSRGVQRENIIPVHELRFEQDTD